MPATSRFVEQIDGDLGPFQMSIGIDPTVDFAFEKLLGSPEFPQVTVHFLNSVLGESANVTDVIILNPIIGKDYDDDKLSLLDVLAEDAFGRN